MIKVMAIVLLIALFPALAAAIILGILVHPLFFLMLLLAFLFLPAITRARSG